MSYELKPEKLNVPGLGTMNLYPIAKIAQALTDAGYYRDPQTIKLWISKGTLPEPMFTLPAKGRGLPKKRLWTLRQINVIVQTAVEMDIKQCQSMKPFAAELRERLKEFNQKNYYDKIMEARKNAEKAN